MSKKPPLLLCKLIEESQGVSTNDLSEKIKKALEMGASPNEMSPIGNPVLSIFCSKGDPFLVRQMLEAGSDVNGKSTDDGWTALHACAVLGNLKLTSILFEFGADETLRNDRQDTAMDCAGHVNNTIWIENSKAMLSARSAMQAINEVVAQENSYTPSRLATPFSSRNRP